MYSCLQAPQLRHVTLSAPTIALQQFDNTHACKRHSCDMIGLLHQQSLYNSLTCTHACKRHSCDMLRFLHQQSLYNSLTYSCLQAPQLRHVTVSAPSIALQQFDILMLASATVATCYAFCTINRFNYNSLTYSCFQAPQLRHVTFSAPTIALQQFDILMLASATVAT